MQEETLAVKSITRTVTFEQEDIVKLIAEAHFGGDADFEFDWWNGNHGLVITAVKRKTVDCEP